MSERPIAWDLDSVFPGLESPAFAAFVGALEAEIAELPSVASAIEGPKAADLVEMLLRQETLDSRIGHLNFYLYAYGALHPLDESCAAATAKLERLKAALAAHGAEIDTALGALREERFAALLADPALEGLPWRLRERRAAVGERLAPAEERLAAVLMEDARDGWARLADTVFGRMSLEIETPSGPKRAPFAQRYDLFWDSDPAVRRSAHAAATRALRAEEDVLAACLNGLTGSRSGLLRHRGVDPLDDVTRRMGVGRSTIETIIDTLWRHRRRLQDYLNLKRGLLGLDTLEAPDRWAPIGDARGLEPADALHRVAAAVRTACPAFSRAAEDLAARGAIDFAPGPGKAGSAFCLESPLTGDVLVYVNVLGSFLGQTTVAHELGHAFHFEVLRGLRPWRRAIPATLAETASITAEHLFRDGLLADADLPRGERLKVLGSALDAAVNYLLRIPRDFDLDRAIYRQRRERPLTASSLKAAARETHRRWFDDTLAASDQDEYCWASPLNFSTYTNFYNFPYTFGYLLSVAIAARFRERGAAFTDDYVAFLRATGSMGCEAAAATTLGVDVTAEAFVLEALDAIGGNVDALSSLATGTPA